MTWRHAAGTVAGVLAVAGMFHALGALADGGPARDRRQGGRR